MIGARPGDVPDLSSVGEHVQREVERTIQRNIKGIDFLTSPKQPVGAMASDLIVRRGTMLLYRYRPVAEELYRQPLLLIAPPSNKGYIFDLARGQSFVEYMLLRGYDVFLLDWAPPRRDEAGLTLESYVLDFIPDAIARISAITGEPDLTVAGYCMSGTLATMYAALNPRGPATAMICFTTPIDFSHMGLFRTWADKAHFDVDRLVDTLGNIPAELTLGAFDLMRPANRTAGLINLWTNMWNDEYVKSYRMFDRWAAETLPMPGGYFRQLVKDLLWDNALIEGGLKLDGRSVELSNIRVPILSVLAQHDHVVSPEAAAPLLTQTGSTDAQEIMTKGGHVSVVAGPSAATRLWPSIDVWLSEKSI